MHIAVLLYIVSLTSLLNTTLHLSNLIQEINSIEMVCLSGTLADDDSVCVAVPRRCVSYQILAVGTRSLALMMMFTSNTNNLSQWVENKANLIQLTPSVSCFFS